MFPVAVMFASGCKNKAYSSSAATARGFIILTNCVECSDLMKVCDDEECLKNNTVFQQDVT